MPIIKSFRDLNVYRAARAEARKLFEVSAAFPKAELYSLTNQIRRSSRAVNAMIAEVGARRRYEAAFINKINEAMGESMETQAWLDAALDCRYITEDQHQVHDAAMQSVGAMLASMIEKADSFCQSPK